MSVAEESGKETTFVLRSPEGLRYYRGYATDLITDHCLEWLRARGGEEALLVAPTRHLVADVEQHHVAAGIEALVQLLAAHLGHPGERVANRCGGEGHRGDVRGGRTATAAGGELRRSGSRDGRVVAGGDRLSADLRPDERRLSCLEEYSPLLRSADESGPRGGRRCAPADRTKCASGPISTSWANSPPPPMARKANPRSFALQPKLASLHTP